jgi:competence protein ComEA
MFRTLLSAIALVSFCAVSQAAPPSQSTASARASAKPTVAGTININTAAAAELEKLPGIGAKTAGRILEYRQKNGPFKKVEELMNVRGVGEKNFLKLRTQISVGAAKADHVSTQQ